MRTRLTSHAALILATSALGFGGGAVVMAGSPTASAQGYVPCEQWQAMHPGWPCIDTPTVPPVPPGGPPTVSTPPPLPSQAPGLPSQPGGGGGIGAGALTPPPIPPGNGTPIVPVPGAESPAPPGDQAPAPPPRAPLAPAPETSNAAAPSSEHAPAPTAVPAQAPTPAAPVTTAPLAAERDSHVSSAPAHRGGDERVPWLLLAGVAAFLAPVSRLRGGGGSSRQLTITKPWDGGEQTFILMDDPSAPRDYRFPQDAPPGGVLRKNPDGSVDVLDANGHVVSHTNPPWAYDALGRPVDTWYDLDGDTIVQHIDPDPENVFPILADPDTVPSCSIDGQGGAVITHSDGTQTNYPADNTSSASAGVGPQQQAADQLARAHGDVPDDFTGHVPLPPQKTDPSSSAPANSTAPQTSTYQPSPAEQRAADQLAHAHADVPDDYTGAGRAAPGNGAQRQRTREYPQQRQYRPRKPRRCRAGRRREDPARQPLGTGKWSHLHPRGSRQRRETRQGADDRVDRDGSRRGGQRSGERQTAW
ncbi:hypothetical protein [Nocardia heshunensis]